MNLRVICLLIVTLFGCMGVYSQSENADPIKVGVKESPPFVIQSETGEWSGLSLTLWRQAALNIGLEFEIEEYSLEELIQKVTNGEIDIAVASLTVTPEREAAMDFTHPYFSSGLGVAVPAESDGGIFFLAQRFFSIEFLSVLAFLAVLLLLFGFLVWLFERKANPEEFGGKSIDGILSGFWWSAVTMTTVGYGDKSPKTFLGRCVGLVWMFAGIIVISGITASITSALTVSQLEMSIQSSDDLAKYRVATLADSTSEAYLRAKGIRIVTFQSIDDALDAVAQEHVDAAVYDAPILQYSVLNRSGDPLQVLPFVFDRQDYGFALPSGSELREPLNVELLNVITSELWQNEQTRLLGSS